jgi:hypothetical protein
MTTTLSSGANTTERAGAVTIVLSRRILWLLAVILPIGPACVALARYLLPYTTADDNAEIVRSVVANPGAQGVVLWLAFVAVLTLVPGAAAAGLVTRAGAPRLTTVAVCLLVPGYISLGYLVGSDAMLWAGAVKDVDQATLLTLWETMHGSGMAAGGVFVIGHVLGTVLLGMAMWRSRSVPRWAAVATAVSQPLHFVAAVIVGSHTLDLFAWGLTAVGMAACSYVLVSREIGR